MLKALQELMGQDSALTVPIIETLSNLVVPPGPPPVPNFIMSDSSSELMKGVHKQVVHSLNSAQLEDLPVVIRFLLQSLRPDTAREIGTDHNDL